MRIPREYERESNQDGNGDPYCGERTNNTRSDYPNTYLRGYTHGRAAERSRQDALSGRDGENTARALLVGSTIASLAVLGGAYAWYLSQPESSDSPASPAVVPVPEKPQLNSIPEQKTTILERVGEVPVFVPVPKRPSPTAVSPNHP